MDANDAASYVQNLAGEDANIIFGAMYDDTAVDSAKITVIATGLNDATAKQASVSKASAVPAQPVQTAQVKEAAPEKPAFSQGMTMPSFQMPKANPGAPTSSTVPVSYTHLPSSGNKKPPMIRSVVVLPQPDGPRRVRNSFSRI